MRLCRSSCVAAAVLAALVASSSSALAAAPPLDPTFGTSGVTTSQFEQGGSQTSTYAARAATQSTGAIVVAGTRVIAGQSAVFAARYTATGAYDAGFNSVGGSATYLEGNGTGAGATGGTDVATDASDRIFLTGQVTETDAPALAIGLQSNGEPRTGFGTFGEARIAIPGSTRTTTNAIFVQPDGKVIVAGYYEPTLNAFKPFVARFTAAGAADASFATGGVYTLPDSACGAITPNCRVADMAVQMAGSTLEAIYLAGDDLGGDAGARVFKVVPTSGNDAVAIDAAYGSVSTPGAASTLPVQLTGATGIGLDGGRVVVAGGAAGTTQDCAVARLTAAGALDATFDADGVAVGDVGQNCLLNDVVVQAGGYAVVGATFAGSAVVGRFLPSGAPDSDFTDAGIAIVTPGGTPSFFNGAVASGSGFAAVGAANGPPHDYLIARYLTSAPPSPTVTLTSPTDGQLVQTDQPTFSGTAGTGPDDDGTVRVELHRRNADGSAATADVGFVLEVQPDGTFAGRYPGSLSDGGWVARVHQNEGTPSAAQSATTSFRVDIHGPGLSIDAPGDGAVIASKRPTVTGSAGTAAGDSAQVRVEFRQSGFLKSSVTVTRGADGRFSATPGDDLDEGGTFTATASQVDDAGHAGTSNTRTFSVFFPPVNTRSPAFSGAGTVGSVMHADLGDWTGTAPTEFAVLWQRCPDLDLSNCTNAGGGIYPNGLDYTVTSDDIGYRLFLIVVATNKAGQVVSDAGSFTGVVPDPNVAPGSNGAQAGSPKVRPPALDHAPKQSTDACQSDLYFGPVGVHASCFKRVGLTWESGGQVDVNGLHLKPSGGAKVVIDPMNLRIATHGTVSVVAGPATVSGHQIGPFTLYNGSFDWVMQANVRLPSAPGLATQIPGFGDVGHLPSLGQLSDLPGLGSLASLPRLADGLPDFSRVSAGDLGALRIPTLDAARMQIPAYYLPVAQLPTIGIDTGSGAQLFGLPLQGKLALKMIDSGVRFDAALGLPQLGNVAAAAEFKVFNDGRFEIDDVKAHGDEVNLGVVSLRPIDLHYNGAQDLWDGTASAFLPFPGAPGIGATATVQQQVLKRVGLSYDGNFAIGTTGVFLSHIDFVLDHGPPQRFTSGIKLTGGPKIGGVAGIGLDGTFIYQAGAPAKFGLTGNLSLVGHPLADAGAEYHTDGYFHAFGGIDVHVGPGNAFGVRGRIDGAVSKQAFDMAGSLRLDVPGIPAVAMNGAVSSVGIAGCGDLGPFSAGASYRWKTNAFSLFQGCDLSAFHPLGANARAARAGDGSSFSVRAGLPGTVIAVRGAGAAPKVVVRGPDGASVTTPADSIDAVRDSRFLLVQSPMDDTTYVALIRPAGGTWTVTPEPGSVPIARIDAADTLHAANVAAQVRGHGHKRRLSWKLTPIKGQTVQFFERSAKKVDARIATTARAAGTVSFAPADGPGGRRQIVAVVLQDGLVRTTKVVAGYVAPPPRRLAAPRHVVVKRAGSRLKVRWHRVAGARRYRVLATVNGGARIVVAPKGRATHATVTGVFGDERATVRVTAVDATNRDGRATTVTLRAPKVHRPSIPGLPAKRAKAKGGRRSTV